MENDLISRSRLLKELEDTEINNRYSVAVLIHIQPTVEQPQGECENCDFRKFTEKFIDGVVEVMNENGITSIEQLSEILKGGAE